MSQLVQRSFSIAASSFTDDLLEANNIPVVARRDQVVQAAFVASAAGLFLTIATGNNLVARNVIPSTQNRVPINPDDYNMAIPMLQGDDLVISVRETSAGILTLFLGLIINP